MNASIRAKMVVNTVSQHHSETGMTEQIKASAVYSDKEGAANKQWAQWTPQGSLELWISNPGAQGRMKPGQFFYVDLIPCEKESP